MNWVRNVINNMKEEVLDMARLTATRTEGKKVSFTISAPNASSVMLAGSFNNWNYTGTSLKKNTKNGSWTRELTLKPGRYEYKYIVDGRWINDPNNRNTIRNPYGTENSLIIV